MPTPRFTDYHVHIISNGQSPLAIKHNNIVSEGKLREKFLENILKHHGLAITDPEFFDDQYISHLSNMLKRSKRVASATVFGLDGVYDHNGELDKKNTRFMITNDYVYNAIKKYKNLKFAASINPKRSDAIEELKRSKKRGTTLIKILPNSQGFNPADNDLTPFYKSMAREKIPLLSHTGYEFALISRNQSFGNLQNLRTPLEQGVTVIGAHGCATGLILYEKFRNEILDMVRQYPNFYIDISALTMITRFGIIKHLQKHRELVGPRLLFGTDYPLPIRLYPFLPLQSKNKKSTFERLRRIENYFDRYLALFEELGLSPELTEPVKTKKKGTIKPSQTKNKKAPVKSMKKKGKPVT